jgi:hypothetical protein
VGREFGQAGTFYLITGGRLWVRGRFSVDFGHVMKDVGVLSRLLPTFGSCLWVFFYKSFPQFAESVQHFALFMFREQAESQVAYGLPYYLRIYNNEYK